MKKILYGLLLSIPFTQIKTEEYCTWDFEENSVIQDQEIAACRSCGSCGCKSACIKYKKSKAFCALLTKYLRVTGNAHINGNLIVDGTLTTAGIFNNGSAEFDDLTVNGTFTTLGPVNMGANDTEDIINIGTGGSNRFVNIGNTNTGSETRIFGNEDVTDGITLSAGGNVRVMPFNITFVTAPFTVNPQGRVGRLTISGLATPFGQTSSDIVISSSAITNLSAIIIGSIGITGAEDAQMSLKRMVVTPGTLTINLRNNGTQNLISNVNLAFWILN